MPESNELIFDGTEEILLSELTEMLCWCTGYGDDSVG